MYQSSEAFGNWIQQDSRTFQARITLEGKTITEGILSIRINGGSNSEDDFSLGSAVSRYVELEIEKTGMRFEGYEFSLELGLNGEYIPMGYFTAEKPKGDEERLSITAYDRMVKTERACFLELPDSTNTVAVLKGVGTIAGIEVVTEGLTAIPIKKPVGYTCREVLSYVAQLYGGFAICNRAGKIEIKSYEDNDYTVTAGRYWDSFTHNDLPFVLGKITCYTGKNKKGEDISIHVGDGVRGIYFSNPFMDQTALDNIWGKLRNYTYMPGSFHFLGDPRIDPWDVLTVKDRNENAYKVPAMKLTQEYDGGLSTEVEAVGKTEAEQSTGFTGPNTQNMDRLYAQLVLIDHAMINKLDVDTAKITYATIDNLNALKAEIEQLDVTELAARVAKIEKAYITDAEVKTLLAGYATIGNLNATNAQITSLSGKFAAFEKTTTEELVAAKGWLLEGSIGDAQISRVSANKLTAGTIDTTIITVAGSDGHLRISDNTIQIKDLQRVRVQIGKDASGEYSLSVWDKAGKLIWDALGATESTIQRKIIRDKMVADDAAINALKLDLKSFNTALTEQGVSISGTVVQVGNKTLNVELTEQRQLTTEHGETLTDHAARITANENAIKLKVSTQEYESYKTTVNGEIATAKSRLNAAESSISVMKDQIALKVEQTDIEEAVNNIQVGGRNLLVNSTFNRQGYKWSAGYAEGKSYPKEGRDGGYCAKITGKFNTNCYLLHEDAYRVKAGETYTLSSWTKSKDIVKGTTNYFVSLYIGFYDKDNKYKAEAKINNGQMPLSTNWERNILTFTVPDVSGIEHMWVYLYARDFTGTIWWDDVQLEKANKASDWSPALEDIEEDIAEVDGKFVNYSTTVQMNAAITAARDSITSTVSRTYATKTEVSSVSGKVTSLESWKQEASQKITKDGILSTVGNYYATSKYVETVENGVKENEKYIASVETLANQASNKFLWLVKSGTSATNFELTDRTATLIANAINLKGLVTFSGLNSDTQSKINTAQSTANTAKNNATTAQSAANAAQSTANTAKNNAATAQSTANTAKSTADAVTSTVNANKANWDKGYNWTSTNGGNIINLLTMVKAWTGGAVSATTTINGGFIRTNTITAAQIALGDFTNLVDVNESLPQSVISPGTHPFTAGSEPAFNGGYITKKDATAKYVALSSYKPNSFSDGDEIYYEFTARRATVGKCYIGIWFYGDGTPGNKEYKVGYYGTVQNFTTSDVTYSGVIKLTNIRQYGFYAIGIYDDGGAQMYVKNISVHKRSKGNLIVDGAITTDKLAAQSVTAAKINVKDLFAQDITATGTIRGVTLRGSKGEIGGFQINSTRLYSVDSSGTYAAYFGSYDFNKTNAFVAQTKVNGSWVNTLEMRYDGSIISRDKKNTNYRTTIQEGTVTCTGNDGWSTSTTVELRNGEIWFYRNKDSIEASIGFDEHGQNSNSATARVTRINASNSGLLLSCQNTPGLYIYKNSLRAWVNLDMNHKSIINSSDERLKTNILPFTSSVLPELGRLGIVSYEWKETGEQVKAGFTAQNMQSVFPELVEANDAGILGIKTLELMPYVVKGVQELTNKTEELQEQIKKVRCQQEGDTISLRAQVSSLQYQLQQAFNQLAIQAEQIKKLQVEG
nr:MAG TPA: Minor structural protein [Caudoviricetes sp.]